MQSILKRRATFALALICACALAACGGDSKRDDGGEGPARDAGGEPAPDAGDPSVPPAAMDLNDLLPFDPLDPEATFTATLLIEDRTGGHPPASLVYDGETYTSDEDGKIVIPDVKVLGQTGLRVQAEGYMPRSVVLEYRLAGGEGMRVVLESPGVTRTFPASDPARLLHGPIVVDFEADSYATADGEPYTGTVHVAALGIDPVASVVHMTDEGLALRPDFDIDRIPQGYGLAVDEEGGVHFMLPESIFQVELSGDDGEPLQLQSGKQAQFTLKLTGMSTHQPGDVVPTFTFDEEAQHWVEEGTCTVELTDDDQLQCVGRTPHFSSWVIASGANSQRPACGNLKFRVRADAKYEPAPVAIDVQDVKGARDMTSPTTGEIPQLSSTSGACFFQAQSHAQVRAIVTLRQRERVNGMAVYDRFEYVWGATTPSSYPSNLRLARSGAVSPEDLDRAKLDADCLGCPPLFVDLDLREATPHSSATVDPDEPPPPAPKPTCEHVTCATGATCSGSGTCSCPDGQVHTQSGCTPADCEAPTAWDQSALACLLPDPCQTDRGGCDTNAVCTSDESGAAVCTCRPGYEGDGESCTPMTTCTESTCLNGGTCTETSSGYTCECAAGFSGTNCETNINDCMASEAPCDTNATCTDGVNSFTCSCNAGYAGAGTPGTCTNIDACVDNPCTAGFACTDLPPPAGNTTGDRTCANIDACVNNPCGSGEVCEDLPPPATDSAEGRTCEPDVDACINNPCFSGYVCVDLPAPAGDDPAGRTCEDEDECELYHPCDPNATCHNEPGLYSCECNDGWIGDGYSCTASLPSGSEANLESGSTGTLDAGHSFDNVTYGVEVTYQGGAGLLTGVRVTGLSNAAELYARVYDSSHQLVASGDNIAVTGDTAEVYFSSSYWLLPFQPLRVAIWSFDATLELYTPMEYGYNEDSNTFSVESAWTSAGDAYPAEEAAGIPRMTLLFEPS